MTLKKKKQNTTHIRWVTKTSGTGRHPDSWNWCSCWYSKRM